MPQNNFRNGSPLKTNLVASPNPVPQGEIVSIVGDNFPTTTLSVDFGDSTTAKVLGPSFSTMHSYSGTGSFRVKVTTYGAVKTLDTVTVTVQ